MSTGEKVDQIAEDVWDCACCGCLFWILLIGIAVGVGWLVWRSS